MLALRLQFCGHNLPMLNARHVLFDFQLAPKNNRHRAQTQRIRFPEVQAVNMPAKQDDEYLSHTQLRVHFWQCY